jgi:hypothetical protein
VLAGPLQQLTIPYIYLKNDRAGAGRKKTRRSCWSASTKRLFKCLPRGASEDPLVQGLGEKLLTSLHTKILLRCSTTTRLLFRQAFTFFGVIAQHHNLSIIGHWALLSCSLSSWSDFRKLRDVLNPCVQAGRPQERMRVGPCLWSSCSVPHINDQECLQQSGRSALLQLAEVLHKRLSTSIERPLASQRRITSMHSSASISTTGLRMSQGPSTLFPFS